MNRLSIASLLSLFIFCGSWTFSTILLFLLYNGVISFSYLAIICLNFLLTYYTYGLTGVLYMAVSLVTMMGCGFMYWSNISSDSVKIAINNSVSNLNNISFINTSTKTLCESGIYKRLINGLEVMSNYRKEFTRKIYNNYLTQNRIDVVKNSLIKASDLFDCFCAYMYVYLCMMRTYTQNLPVFKNIYFVFDQIVESKTNFDSFKDFHNLSIRPINIPEVSLTLGVKNSTSSSGSRGSSGSSGGGIKNIVNGPDINSDIFGEINDMSKQFKTMSPEQLKQMDEMAKQIFQGMGSNNGMNFMGMFDDMQKMDQSSTNPKSIKNQKK
jgi:hypothetical protein